LMQNCRVAVISIKTHGDLRIAVVRRASADPTKAALGSAVGLMLYVA
jgi:hypothetical protein